MSSPARMAELKVMGDRVRLRRSELRQRVKGRGGAGTSVESVYRLCEVLQAPLERALVRAPLYEVLHWPYRSSPAFRRRCLEAVEVYDHGRLLGELSGRQLALLREALAQTRRT